jgi:hypothetical protein
MDPSEVAWRIRGLLRDQIDVVRVPLGKIPGLPNAMRNQPLAQFEPGFRCSPVSRDRFDEFSNLFDREWRDRLKANADSICLNKLSYFDLEDLDHGTPFQWHRDHSAGIDAPLRLSVLTDYRDFSTYGDCKLVWEPNRHHQFVVLGRAWIVTGESKYVDKIFELMRSWMDANPFGYGMNWKSPLEHGIRIINWIWALDLVRGSGRLDDDTWARVQETLFRLMWDTQRRYSQGSSANNHLIGEVAGVFFGACYFTGLPKRDAWIREAQAVLEREILLQTYASGCTREHAFGYQFFVLQFFHQCLHAGEQSGFPFSEAFKNRLHAMYRFMREISEDFGDIPNLNDRDDGYVVDLGATQRQPTELVSAGAHLFEDADLSMERCEANFWLYGTTIKPSSEEPTRSVGYQDAGYFILRDGRAAVFVDAAPLGYGPIAAHGHADCLSFVFSVDGQPVFIDSGTYDYFSHPALRDYFRTTAAHNTVEIDGESQSEMQGPFLWGRRATPSVLSWRDLEVTSELEAEHDGYRRLPDPVTHRRKLVLHKENQTLEIIDSLICDGVHTARLYLHLAPGCRVSMTNERHAIVRADTLRISVRTDWETISIIEAGADSPLGWTSPSYHVKQPSACLVFEQQITDPTSMNIVISCGAAGDTS